MRVKLLYFASIRETVGTSEEIIEVGKDTSIVNLKNILQSKYPKLNEHWNTTIISINKKYSNLDSGQKLNDGDEIAIFPPISGG
jgi:molybdopterin synthase sulfur carrier subunit